MVKKKCDVCKKGYISFSKWKKGIDAEGKEWKYQEVKCSNKYCLINGLQVSFT